MSGREKSMETATVTLINLGDIAESPLNPRRTYDPVKLQELADSIRGRGVDSPVKVRTAPGGMTPYELVFGHRRLRASRLAGRATIPSFIVQMTDAEVRAAQLVENGQREDVHPIEEADSFETTMRLDGLTAKEVADKIGKSESYVHARLKLAKLCEPAREAFLAGKLTPSTALIVARIPNAKLQAKATEEIASGRFNREPMSAAEASAHVRRNYMLRLVDAPFDRADATLVPAAGACSSCPKRTGAQRELFADVEDKDDLCIDPACWSGKLEALWTARVEAAKKRKQPVLTDTKKLFPWGTYLAGPTGSKYVDFYESCYEDPKSRTYAQLLKKLKPVTTLARDPSGKIRELLPKAGLEKLLKDAGHDFKAQRAEDLDDGEEGTASECSSSAAGRKLREKVTEAAVLRMVAAIEAGSLDLAPLRIAARRVAENGNELPLERRGVGEEREDLDRYLAGLTAAQLLGLIFEVSASYSTWGDDYDETLVEDAPALGVDLKALERELAPAPAPTSAPAAAPAKGKKAKASAPAIEELPPVQAAPAGALAVACPLEMCKAEPGAGCKNYKGKACAPHADRVRAAQKASAGAQAAAR